MKAKNSYSVDAKNRLVIKRKNKKLTPKGKFGIDKKNYLYYWLNEPSAWRRQYDLPLRIKFTGNWQLTKEHDLVLRLTKSPGQIAGERLVFKGDIIAAEGDTLVFEIQGLFPQQKGLSPSGLLDSRVKGTVPELMSFSLLKLGGFWQADEFNRIGFVVKKDTYPQDVLTFQGIWQVGKNQEITYTYKKTSLLTKEKTENNITFKGFWQLTGSKQLAYILERGGDSVFNFRVHLETPNLYPKEGVIKYRLGIGLKGLSPQQQGLSPTYRFPGKSKGTVPAKIISLYGTWKFSRKLGVSFEMDYGEGKIKKTDFATELTLSDKHKIILGLLAKDRKPMGISLTIKRALLKKYGAEAFLKLGKTGGRLSAQIGVRIPF